MPEFFATRFNVAMSHPLVRLIAMTEQVSIRVAHQVITPTEAMRRAFVSRGAAAEKLVVVMDGADETVFRSVARDRDDVGSVRFRVVSHGTIEPQYGLDTLIRAAPLLASDIPGLQVRSAFAGQQEPAGQRVTTSPETAQLVL